MGVMVCLGARLGYCRILMEEMLRKGHRVEGNAIQLNYMSLDPASSIISKEKSQF